MCHRLNCKVALIMLVILSCDDVAMQLQYTVTMVMEVETQVVMLWVFCLSVCSLLASVSVCTVLPHMHIHRRADLIGKVSLYS